MTNEEAYVKIIEIISENNFDPRKVSIKLAQTHPQIFIEIIFDII